MVQSRHQPQLLGRYQDALVCFKKALAIEEKHAIVWHNLGNSLRGLGKVEELGDFGDFWLRGDSEGAETAADVRASSIKGVLPRFINAGKEFKKVLDTIEFEKA